jgi:hypothetical protein
VSNRETVLVQSDLGVDAVKCGANEEVRDLR